MNRNIDADTLSVRVYLTRAETFINVFYNITTDKTAFALVESGQRVYGVDNAKKGWHEHPFGDPARHVACAPVQFEGFLASGSTLPFDRIAEIAQLRRQALAMVE